MGQHADTRNELKTPAGRLREAGARRILEMRSQDPKPTYQQIAYDLGVSIGTVFNVCKGRTWAWLGGEHGQTASLAAV